MSFGVEILNEQGFPVDEDRLRTAAELVLTAHDVQPGSAMTVVLTTNDAVAGLNRQFRQIDAPTDVLSFPADAPPVEIADEPPYLGDLLIAYPYAAEQAAREDHPLQDSLALLVVHGTLHLLGYDHDTPENRSDMWAAQAEALRKLNIAADIVPLLEGTDHDE